MEIETRVNDLLLQWEELREQGQPVLSAEKLCADCPELVEELKRRIQALEWMDARMRTPKKFGTPEVLAPPAAPGASAAGTPVPTPPAAGSRYRTVRFHARGGLGEVFVAHDEELHREVALKRLQPARLAEAASRRRFLREAEITARLEHPGVVPVHGLVQDSAGQPSYAMRFIQGETLHEAIQRYHAPDQPSSVTARERRLALRQLLNRLVAVCNTVAYAHSRGIVHRDLKPGNIMLGPYGETLVVDWGLAKPLAPTAAERAGDNETWAPPAAADDAGGTALGQAMGTPAYMSPEQAVGQWDVVGPASDVYSLGATLYAVLTGRPPFQDSQAWAVLVQVQRGSYSRPRQVNNDVPPALEAICRKAMALQPADRYATASALAADLEHWLADEAVMAYPDSWSARLGRWARRHRTLVASAMVLLAAAVVALAVGIGFVQQEQERTRDQRDQAAENFQMARDAANKYLVAVAADPDLKSHNLRELRRRLLDSAAPLFRRLVEKQPTEPQLQAERGQAYMLLAFINQEIGLHAEAIDLYREAQTIFTQLARAHPADPRYQADLAKSHNDLGVMYQVTQRLTEAEQAHQDALAIRMMLVHDSPHHPPYQADLAKSHNKLGGVYLCTQRFTEAEQAFQKALDLLKAVDRDSPNVPDYQADLASTYNNLAVLYERTDRRAEAVSAHQAAVEVRRNLVRHHPAVLDYQQDLAVSCTNLGNLYQDIQRFTEAEEAYQDALNRFKDLAKYHPTVPQYQYDLAKVHHDLGELYQRQRSPKAEQAFQNALSPLTTLVEQQPTHTAYEILLGSAQYHLGELAYASGSAKDALDWYRQAEAMFQRVLDHQPQNINAAAAQLLGQAHWGWLSARARVGQYGEATAEAERRLANAREASTFVSAARVYAAAAAAHDDAHQAGEYAAHAVGLLRAAVAKGFRNDESLKNDSALNSLQSRTDFQQLLSELANQAKTRTP